MSRAELAAPIEPAISPATFRGGLGRRRAIVVAKTALLVMLLALHFATRWQRSATMPLADRHNYERVYVYSLSLMAGRGFHDIAIPDTAAAAPVARFLDKQSNTLDAQDFEEFLKHSRPDDVNVVIDDHQRWVSSRILDQYVIAGLWRLFGIRWDVVFDLCVVMSTLTCLIAFLIGRQLTGSYWGGLAAAVLFFVSPIESQLQAWSLRDVSPLWFEALGFWTLLCVLDRIRLTSTFQVLLGAAALSICTMIGAGWRPDVFISWFYLGIGMLVLFKYRGIRWTRLAAAAALYCAIGWICVASIRELSSEPEVDSENGFHMAVYADFSRSNLLRIENTFQILRCDRETMFLARQHAFAVDPESPPLPYIGKRYSHACREMFLEEAKYNAFRFASNFPSVYWQSLNGLKIPGAFATLNAEELREGRLSWLSGFYSALFDPLAHAAPYLFLLGLLAATALGTRPLESALVAGITVLQAVALLLVLPEQKHLGTLQLPLSILAGIGLWTLLKSLRFNRRRAMALFRWRPSFVWTGTAVACLAVWGITCLIAYFVSRHERDLLIDAIESRAQRGTPAAGILHGEKVFSVRFAPNSEADQTGYLLKISAGADPGNLLCRHIHYPQDWCWPRVLETTHRLARDKSQYFFVSCMQGSRFGDPRPYSCSVFVEGDAKIESCVRVDLKDWSGLQVSTVFYDGQNSPGSPRAPEGNSVMRWPNWPAFRGNYGPLELDRVTKDSQYVGPQKIPAPSSPLDHLIARNQDSNLWEIAASDGHKFTVSQLTYWAPGDWSSLVTGDFSGGGLTDLLGRRSDGSWWIGHANGNNIEFKPCAIDLPMEAIDFVGAGDFNGDKIDDVAVRDAKTGAWWVLISDGQRFSTKKWGQWAGQVPANCTLIGDFNGDGRADIAGLDPRTGDWNVSASDGAQFVTSRWGSVKPNANWKNVLAGDFIGDGKLHVIAMDAESAEWTLGRSNGERFDCQSVGKWPLAQTNWTAQTGRFGPDRRRSLIGIDPRSGEISLSMIEGQQLVTQRMPGKDFLRFGAYIGDFRGNGVDQIAGVSMDNKIFVGQVVGDTIHFEQWGTWPSADRHAERRVTTQWRP